MYIVAEYLFIENFIINYLILLTTKKITRTNVSSKRIIVTAIIAALYPFILFIPSLLFLGGWVMKFFISVLIVKIGFNSKSLKHYIKQVLGFYTITFLFAGASIGMYYFTNDYGLHVIKSNNYLANFSFRFLVLGIIMGTIMIKSIFNYFKEKTKIERDLLNVEICFNGKTVSLISLIDTGNSLIEPISRDPVLVVEYEIMRCLLPEELIKIFDTKDEKDFTILERTISSLKERILIRLIPFKAIGTNSGILIGFRPDYIRTIEDNKMIQYDNVMVGIFNGSLTKDKQYNSLLNSEILIRGDLNVNEV